MLLVSGKGIGTARIPRQASVVVVSNMDNGYLAEGNAVFVSVACWMLRRLRSAQCKSRMRNEAGQVMPAAAEQLFALANQSRA